MKKQLTIHGTSGNVFFDIWSQLRGFTAPLFFAITGLVFAYLLTGDKVTTFWKQKRVRKGIKRGFLIIFWGYILQLNVKNIPYYLSGRINDRFFAFHVLQSIGLGILVIIMLYGIYYSFKWVRFSVLLFVSGLIVFSLAPFINSLGESYFPTNAPQIIQNVINGPYSIFPITPWLGYVLFGATLGAVIREQSHRLNEKWFPFHFVLIGVLINMALLVSFRLIDFLVSEHYDFAGSGWPFVRFTEILVLLGILMFTERFFNKGKSFFMMMGQNTLAIYIIHVMLLYGAVIGIGIRTWFDKSLTFNESILSAIAFILFFGVLTKVQPAIIQAIKYFPNKLFSKK